ncbi:MAG: tRNA 2-selenouridine(34) synthase MnmH [Desulfuromonadales bacterium GWD2_61_12]|nr:MAG: tRNA 2-selenouridine(34) synthase MnmH [Desulfuromonadales bacterium GWC2_61_20]OGR35722.1 MAG: tRNA 2-selenouridine(34) synthase MnmH [Desulfuromonadales bacterium GWD2_61_12]HAD04409.1 tRNA 2-selenouridine(34) synthase MnmH [Desulfuromonas sp.]HBT82953.1 tRNA 2-selenouridine(34) synthase MnmH [Desulfuromonas sp.]
MTTAIITLEQALALRDKGALLIDARSPAEFAETTIPGAVNVPLFDDLERAEVGTLYKEAGKKVALKRGMELVAPKIPALIAMVEAASGERRGPVLVFCWRGGMRSRALTTFLELAGITARQIEGGHKAFRALVRDFFERGEWGRLLVLRGLTGVGKTRLLLRLQQEGYPVIDLEGLAHHRGSAFGYLGLPAQPSQKAFEARLWDALRRVPAAGYALAEGESRHIGRLILPQRVHQALQVETSLWIEASLDYRVAVVLDDYPACEELQEAFLRPLQLIRPRLGGEAHDRLVGHLQAGRWAELARELMVLYYDPLYDHTCPDNRIDIAIEPEGEGLVRLKAAIARLLAAPPGALLSPPAAG